MYYTVDIESSIESFAHCIEMVKNGIEDVWDWHISINAGGIDYGVYFNFNLNNKELEISNQCGYGCDEFGLAEIIDIINCEDYE